MSRRLIDEVQPGSGFLRATNIEVHGNTSGGYIPTSKALELLSRFTRANREKDRGQSWSLTGPYGSGKSSFAVFLSNLLGPPGRSRSAAETALRAADEQLAAEVLSVRESLAGPQGFLLATATSQQEPVVESLLRAVDRAIATRWGEDAPPAINKVRSAARATRDSRAVVRLINELSNFAPVLLILDEFGKTLEHFAARAVAGADVESDLFVLQELAERSSGAKALPLFTFTLQHLAFDDYVRQASSQQRREWGKVQGRFEDVSFVESAEQSLRLVAGSLDWSKADPRFIERRNAWAADVFGGALGAGMANHLPGGLETVEQCYPLHPVALLALPELSARLGQHGRTLFTFLASSERNTLLTFLKDRLSIDGAAMDVLRLPDLFDFFAGTGQSMALSIGGSRWREILERVMEASHLPAEDLLILKSVGLLNLVGNKLGLRASTGIIAYALSDVTAGAEVWRGRLDDLESRGFVTFRAFADEYRLWQGSDVDLRGRVADAREQLRTTSAADLLTSLQFSDPVIAARHSQRVGMLRYFSISYSDDSTRTLSPAAATDPADGRLVYHLGSADLLPSLSESESRPTVFVTSAHARRVREAAIELAAALSVLDQQDVLDDRVARRELQDRVADARTRLKNALAESFSPGVDGVTYRVAASGKNVTTYDHVRSVSALLSEVCDDVYFQSPEIRNEMLARRELTSQGAKARRLLIEAMISRAGEESLGITGYGPDKAMYEAVLRFSGLHVQTATGWGFSKPTATGGLLPVWGAMTQLIDAADDRSIGVDELYATLSLPPLGVKDGPIPVLLTALLLQRSDDVAIYEAGSFQPSLTTDLVERLIKAPSRFRLKSFGASGSRAVILKAVAEATSGLGISGLRVQSERQLRNGTVLAVAAPLLNFVRSMPILTRKTSRVSSEASAVRQALLQAREPDVLLFKDVPDALGITAEMWKSDPRRTGSELTLGLSAALGELQTAYGRQLEEVVAVLAELFNRAPDTSTLREALRYRAEPLEGRVIDPRLQAFIFNVVDDSTDDRGWLELMGLVISGKSVASWLDDDRDKFISAARDLATTFLRVEALNFDMQSRDLHGPFTARRLSLTSPDGQEFSKVVYYDEDSVSRLNQLLDETLQRASNLGDGPEMQDGLLALLFERLIGQVPQQPRLTGSPDEDSRTKENAHGR